MGLPEFNEYYTLADLLARDDIERAELIDGVLYMSPPPSTKHQRVSRRLTKLIDNFLEGKPCEVFSAPFGVYPLADRDEADDDIDTMVEPDITVICDPSKIDDHGCKGAPDFIIEILSPSNRQRDIVTKRRLYQRAGVREYWIVDPVAETVTVYLPDEKGTLEAVRVYEAGDTATISVLNDCSIDLNDVFT